MRRLPALLIAGLFSFTLVYAADEGEQKKPIDIIPKSGQGTNPHGPINSDASITLSAAYDSDSLYIAFSSYSGMAAITVKDAVTGQTVIQTLLSINGTDHSVAAADISSLPEGLYTLSILTQDGMEYEGTFTIGWQSSLLSETP